MITLIIDTTTSNPDSNNNSYHFATFTPVDRPDKAIACEIATPEHALSLAASADISGQEVHFTNNVIAKREFQRLTSKAVKARDHTSKTCPIRWMFYKDVPRMLRAMFP